MDIIWSHIYYLVPLIVATISQSIKIIIDLFSGKSFNRYTLISSGGMPSTHSTITSSALVMVILFEWLFSVSTMMFGVLCIIVWYDAANVRYESGKHAQYINSLKYQIHEVMEHDHIHENNNIVVWDMLRERLGHTWQEIIVWILFGSMVTLWCVALIDSYIVSF